MQEYEIEFYDKADGSEPAKEFILSLDKKMQAKVFVVGKKVILTNGFIKKTQKTPASEITLAKQYRADYLARKENSK